MRSGDATDLWPILAHQVTSRNGALSISGTLRFMSGRRAAPFRVEPIDGRSVRLFDDRNVWRVYDVRVTSERRLHKVPIGASGATARVFVPPGTSGRGRLMYVLHAEASRRSDVDTLVHQVRSAGWMHWMLHPVGQSHRPAARQPNEQPPSRGEAEGEEHEELEREQ